MNERELIKTAADEAFAVKAADLSAADIVSGSVSTRAEVKGRFRYAAVALLAAAAVAVGTAAVLSRGGSPKKDPAPAPAAQAEETSQAELPRADASTAEAANTDSSEPEPPSTVPDPITEKDAWAIALADAGLTEQDVKMIRTEKGTENGHAVYELEITAQDDSEYEYDIDMYSGEIVGRDYEAPKPAPADDSSIAETAPADDKPAAPAVKDDDDDDDDNVAAPAEWLIDQEAAKEAVRKHADLPNAKAILIERDRDDYGRPLYELKFVEDGIEYEYEVDGVTGAILEAESEPAEESYDSPAPQRDEDEEDEDEADEDENEEDEED